MLVRVAINGFGRIGRAAFKIALERNSEIEIVAINDLADIENLVYLLKYDSVYGRYARPVKLEEGNLVADGVTVKVLNEKEPTKLPWKELGVDVVIESTGIFLEEDKINDHLEAGAKRVVVS
ncbi:MAG: glyceraldehyde 3-phosphate dehydrogenase NAD-binding domain-containing protein, partial [Patescibacteria group bacterium]